MTASEYALENATESSEPRESRIASTILGDDRNYREWELRHANLLLPVAEQHAKKHQVLALRNANVQLVHRRALFKYLQTHQVSDERRRQLFRLFHATQDYHEAILAEHRQYMLAFSSGISTYHIVDVMRDESSMHLLENYEQLFTRYFGMKCYIASAGDSATTRLVRSSLRDAEGQLLRIRRSMKTDLPRDNRNNFDREELLSRTRRREPQNYLYV